MTKLKRNIRSSQGLPEAMGFSMLPHSHSAVAITNRLTGSQFRLWHYLMMVDPFADQTRDGEKIYHPIPSPAEIAVAIGASQRTVEKDIKRLEELGLYAKRITQWEGYNITAEAGKIAATKLKNKQNNSESLQDKGGYLTADPAKQPDYTLNSRESGYLTADPVKQPDSALNSRKKPLESLPGKDYSTPQTIQTYSDFTNSLSDLPKHERENFEKFVREEYKKTEGKEIRNFSAFLRGEHFQHWYSKYQTRPEVAWLTQDEKWRHDPRLSEWLSQCRSGYVAFICESGKMDAERKAFYEWANKNHLLWDIKP